MKRLFFDLETETREDAALFLKPVKPPSNYRDPDKIAAYVKDAQETALARGALDAMTARIVAIGWQWDGGIPLTSCVKGKVTEMDVISEFLSNTDVNMCLVGWNSEGFDLPMLFKRCAVLGLKFPPGLRQGRYWDRDRSLDLMQVWQCGDREGQSSLDSVARLLGLPGKLGTGEKFAALLREDEARAIEYLRQDVALLPKISGRLL